MHRGDPLLPCYSSLLISGWSTPSVTSIPPGAAKRSTGRGRQPEAPLDRIFISASRVPYLHSCSAAPDTTSDHLPVIAHVRPAARSSVGRGLPRACLDFLKRQDLADSLWGWIRQEAAAAPTEDAALLDWWPLVKERVAVRLSADSRQHRLEAADLLAELQAARQTFAAALDAA